jgi:hypothetical protein
MEFIDPKVFIKRETDGERGSWIIRNNQLALSENSAAKTEGNHKNT